jgi:8-oxo-dGTP diphosphatase
MSDRTAHLDPRHLDGLRDHPRPSLAVDVVLLTVTGAHELAVVVIDRPGDVPVLPGGFVRPGETPAEAAVRVLRDKTGLPDFYLEQLYTFGAPDRDRRAWVVSVAHYALVPEATLRERLADPLRLAVIGVDWPGEQGGPAHLVGDGLPRDLGYDHSIILGTAIKRLRGRLWYTADAFELLPASFTLAEAQRVFEAIAGRRYNTASFRRRLLGSRLIRPTGERRQPRGVRSRPAALYQLARAEADR